MFWDIQHTFIDDIERIEIIRGPGAAVWGANAFNGVINVVTRHAADTQGGAIVNTMGDEEFTLAGRHGGMLNDDTHYRAYAQVETHDAAVFPDDGGDATDDWEDQRAGFRVDWEPDGDNNRYTLQGDVFDHSAGQRLSVANLTTIADVFDEDREQDGYNIIGRWEHDHDDDSLSRVQVYFDRLQHDEASFDDEQVSPRRRWTARTPRRC